MTKVTLWEHPLSPYAQKNKIALREKGVAFELVTPGGVGSGAAAEDFLKANPRLEVPALVHDGVAIFDSTIIQEYIEETWPEPRLMPVSPIARARARMIEEVMDTQYEAITWGFMEVRGFGRAPGELGEALIARGLEQLAGLNAWLERELAGREWFNGDSFGWADVAVVPFVQGAVGYGGGPARGSDLSDWLARMTARPSVSATSGEAKAAAEAMSQALTAMRGSAPAGSTGGSPAFKREYRDHRLEWMIRSGGLKVVSDGLASDTIRFGRELS